MKDSYEPRPQRRETPVKDAIKGCVGKKPYWSEAEAIAQKLYLESVRQARLGVYHCQHCGNWHLTSK